MKVLSKISSLIVLSIALGFSVIRCSAAGSSIVLPDTGGIGTTIFMVGGVALMVIAVVFLIVKKYKDR